MKPLVSIIMGSTSDLPVMEKAAAELDSMEIPFEMNALSAHRTPEEVCEFAKGAEARGIKNGDIVSIHSRRVIGVPIKGMLDGLDALLSIVQMPPAIPVATVGVNAAKNAAVLAEEMLALTDSDIAAKVKEAKSKLGEKIVKANAELAKVEYKFKTN